MSNALAIAAVTAVLKDLLNNGLIDKQTGPVTIRAMPPDRMKTGDDENIELNLFMYRVASNQGWSNVGYPSFDQDGRRVSNPPLALDLYYLLSAYSKNDLDSEILLGYAMQLLHETPVLTRKAIRKSLEQPSPVSGGILPAEKSKLSAVDLADQVEMIKVSMHSMSTEEMSKLWTAFQAKYRPSVAYHISVVLIESTFPAKAPLPVLTRGQPDPEKKHDEGIISQPNLLPPFPALEMVILPKKQPAIRMGEPLTLQGHHLDGNNVKARFRHVPSSRTLELTGENSTSTGFQVNIPTDTAPDSDNWVAGVYTVIGIIRVIRPTGETVDLMTNELPVALAPTIKSISIANNTVTVTCSPKVLKNQRVTLVIGDLEIISESRAADNEDRTNALIFKSTNLPKGDQCVRLRVDGVESILVDRSGPLPVFESNNPNSIRQPVTIP